MTKLINTLSGESLFNVEFVLDRMERRDEQAGIVAGHTQSRVTRRWVQDVRRRRESGR